MRLGALTSRAQRDATLSQNAGFQVTHRWIVSPSALNELRVGAAKSVPLSYYALHPQTQIVRPSYSTEGLSDYFDERVVTWQIAEKLLWQRHDGRQSFNPSPVNGFCTSTYRVTSKSGFSQKAGFVSY